MKKYVKNSVLKGNQEESRAWRSECFSPLNDPLVPLDLRPLQPWVVRLYHSRGRNQKT